VECRDGGVAAALRSREVSWARSYRAADWLHYGATGRAYDLIHAHGRLMAERVRPSYNSDGWHRAAFPPEVDLDELGPLMHTAFDRLGFRLQFDELPGSLLVRARVPYWALAGVALLVPAGRFVLYRRRSRAHDAGRCPACG
jgi:hypothetical protein